ncbi:toprim domain-containing protein [Methylobacterium sp. J-070]|uniref:DUF7146 domain-containing protein n=1 Tax=Methylobacterium sp. J-070 TaxID=2836650 RepID=UPI001FB8FC14|nr:toprim domain-containing protein [Methylobacterium sp. J-070]MCJ2052610.1 toprim domain-containing protein [Methylobacterium sp. J-070]
MSVRLHMLKAALGGELFGNTLTCPSIGHSAKDRGTSYTEKYGAPGNLLAYVHNGSEADHIAAKDRALEILGERQDFLARDHRPDPVEAMNRRVMRRQAEEADRAEALRRQQRAVEIWNEAQDPRGTPAETYLRSRGLDLTDDVAGSALRYHPRGPWGLRTRSPMMIAAMSDVLTGEVKAIHRTALAPDGHKIDRKMLGPAAGTAIMLTPAAETVAIGEGIESALSAKQLGYGPGIWAMGSAGAMGRLPVLDGVQRLVLLEERDAASANAVSDCGHRWTRAGRAVSVVLPTVGKDLNDALREVA